MNGGKILISLAFYVANIRFCLDEPMNASHNYCGQVVVWDVEFDDLAQFLKFSVFLYEGTFFVLTFFVLIYFSFYFFELPPIKLKKC